MHNYFKWDSNPKNEEILSGENRLGEYKRQYKADDSTLTITTHYADGSANRKTYAGEFNWYDLDKLNISPEDSTISHFFQATWQPSVELQIIHNWFTGERESKFFDSELIEAWEYDNQDHPFADGDHDDYWEHGSFLLGYSNVSKKFKPSVDNHSMGSSETRLSNLNTVKSFPSEAIKRPSKFKIGGKKLTEVIPDEWWLDPFSTHKVEDDTNPATQSDSDTRVITEPTKFNKKSADKITNFNSSTDTLEIDTDSFNIDSSATFAAGASKKEVKKVLAKQDFDFLYDQKKGELYFNENGSDKGFGDGGLIAILKGAPDLTVENLEFI